ncbi:lipopolysaccharide heptosyltransferase I [Sulfurimonas sp.]|uniref:lipopolysaccharide heptosyltransferase I n=1 Tax=Sulfurimonas sp. TaxID=2022749 RepID=UPI002AB26999|nr:lipopolysaccharide heptosyltransferase I [Sulfurimonas sp.]
MKEYKKIAIVRLSALGDIINSAVVLQFIHKKFPNAQIDWITEEVFSPLLKSHHLIHNVHIINLKKIKKEKNFLLLKKNISYLRSLGEFDIVIDMQGLLKSAIVSRFISKNTHGFDKESSREGLSSLFYKTTSKIAYEESIVKRNCFLSSDALGFELSDEMILNKKPIFEIKKIDFIDASKINIAFIIGASWLSKKYPKEKIIQLCNELKENSIIVWGDEDEKKDAEFICKHSSYASIAPKLPLIELLSLISSVNLVIGNDTGPTHMAWAQNIASITLFGPTTSRMIYETPKNIGIKSSSKVDILKINKNDFSIQDIEVKEIVSKAKELLNYEI